MFVRLAMRPCLTADGRSPSLTGRDSSEGVRPAAAEWLGGWGILTACLPRVWCVWLLFVKQVSCLMLRRRDWCVRGAPSCPPHSPSEHGESRLQQQWTFAEAGPVVVGSPEVLWCFCGAGLDLAKYE